MENSEARSTLQRKMDAGRNSAPAGERSGLKALRLALARAASKVFDLPLFVLAATQARCAQDMLDERIKDDRLLILMDGPGGQIGAVSADRACVAALTQHQTMGRVTGAAPAERGFTNTDAALLGPLIDAVLTRATALTDIAYDRQCLSGFRFGARCEDLRSLMLTLEADRFRVFDLTVDFAGGKMQGVITLALPEPENGAVPEPEENNETVVHGPRMEQAVGVAQAELTAVIGRMKLTLSDLSSLKMGDVLPLQNRRLNEAQLMSISNHEIAKGRLGQIDGLRAVRLNETSRETESSDGGLGEFSSQITVGSELEMMGSDDAFGDELGSLDAIGDGLDNLPMTGDDVGLPALPDPDADEAFEPMNTDDVAMEISQLAGLSMEEMAEET